MKLINKFLRNLKPYKLASHKVWMVEPEERKKILKLDWNEATILPSPKVIERIKRLAEAGNFYNLYPATLNEEIIQLLSIYVQLPEENLQYFAGSDSLHEYITKMFVTVGDPVIILAPSYDNFRLTCEANGASLHFSLLNDDFSFDPIRFEKDICLYNPSLVYICNPNNPTGNLHTVDYIESLLDAYPDTIFLIDEAYCEFTNLTCKELVLNHENILITRTMSKAFALANFRFGYLIASKENVHEINKIRNPKNISTFSQEAAIGALSDINFMEKYVSDINESKKFFIAELKKHIGSIILFEGAGNFLLIKFSTKELKDKVNQSLSDNDIFVRNLTHSSLLNLCLRITIGTRPQMERVLKVINLCFIEYEGSTL
ncbi:MAG: histidinol-phosphate transaminase [Bacteroidota bacterium]